MEHISRIVLLFATLLGLAAGVAPPSTLPLFDAFIQLHGRTYQQGSAEYEMRRVLYEKRLEESSTHNAQSDRSWNAGVNKLWDWTEAELQSLRGWDGSARPEHSSRGIRPHAAFLQQKSDLPEEKLWTNLAAASHIKNQANCGSCWAIASATVLEAHTEIYTKQVRTFSAQQIVMCTPNPRHCGGDGGCQGATSELAMDWVLKNGCVDDSKVPYTGEDGKCTAGGAALDMAQMFTGSGGGDDAMSAQGGAAFGMTGWETLPKNTYEPLARALAERGPVAVSVAADSWFNYENGIFNGCGKDAVIDHAVTAMGYGQEQGKKYWFIQNSWGAEWGEAGHIRLERHDADEYCGMNNDPQKGVACQGETAPVPVCGMCGVLFDSVVPHFNEKTD